MFLDALNIVANSWPLATVMCVVIIALIVRGIRRSIERQDRDKREENRASRAVALRNNNYDQG